MYRLIGTSNLATCTDSAWEKNLCRTCAVSAPIVTLSRCVDYIYNIDHRCQSFHIGREEEHRLHLLCMRRSVPWRSSADVWSAWTGDAYRGCGPSDCRQSLRGHPRIPSTCDVAWRSHLV